MSLKSKITSFLSPKNLKKRKTKAMEDDVVQSFPKFPDTLQEFGYHFENGELRHLETGDKFQFVVKENDHTYNQLHYEALGKVIEEYVYKLLEDECGLQRLPVPVLLDEPNQGLVNQTDDAKAASLSENAKATGQNESISQDQVSVEDSSAQADPATSDKNTSEKNEAGSSVNVSDLSENSGKEEASNEAEDVQMEETDPADLAPECLNTSGFVFASEGYREKQKVMVLIHGSGVVRAGQWARRLIINDNLDSGTQIPFIKEALRLGYGVVVMNTNQNYVVDKNGFSHSIPGSESPVAHASYVWHYYIRPCAADAIAVVAHSFGGVVVTHLFQEYKKDFEDKVFAVAFTDSVHCSPLPLKFPSFDRFKKICRNWVTSSEPLDTPLSSRCTRDVPLVSAGVNSHEMTSYASMKSIFKFFAERLDETFAMDVNEEEEQEEDGTNRPDENKTPQATLNKVSSSSDQEAINDVECKENVGEPTDSGSPEHQPA